MSDKNKTLYRTIHPEVKVIDAAKGIVEYIASDESLDSHREVILSKGWKFTRFRKNAPFLNSHSSWSIDDLLGKVISAEVKDGQLIERVQWAIDVEDNALAHLGFQMTDKGYLKAVSVGFLPTRQSWRDSSGWLDAVKEAGMKTEDAAMVRRIFVEQEQIELSSVVIGSNANALAKALDDGAVSEEMLAKVGFDDDDKLQFLADAAIAVESPGCNKAFLSMLDIQMKSLYSERNNSQDGNRPKTGSSTNTRAGVDEAKLHAAEQSAFLSELDSLTN